MADLNERLLALDNNKLIDVVKNYRQYGYDDQLRNTAIQILEDRGISKEQLQLTGNFENSSYDYAQDLYKSFMKNSNFALGIYLFLLLSGIFVPIIPDDSNGAALIFLIAILVFTILYFIFLIKSFLNQYQFYRITGEDFGVDGALIYFFAGMPLYVLMYFYFRKQMKERMKAFA